MGDFLRRQPWIVPLLFALALGAAGLSTLRALEARERAQVESLVETTVETARVSLVMWAEENEQVAKLWAEDERVGRLLRQLAAIARHAEVPAEALAAAPELAELRRLVDPVWRHHAFMGWGAQDPGGLTIAGQTGLDHYLGFRPPSISEAQQEAFRKGIAKHTPPLIFEGPRGPYQSMIVGAPVAGDGTQPCCTLGFSMDPGIEFSRLLEVARLGESGETYAFDKNGVLVSPSRFDAELRAIGLLPDDPESTSALSIEIRDPGGDMAQGFVPALAVRARPLTLAAASAIAGETGSNVDGYSDYRGVPVVGAWTWIPELEIGIASEMDREEAYAGLAAVRLRLGALLGLLVLAALAMGGYSLAVSRLRGRVEQARELGRYRVERKLGQGGMGTVYLAHHALLRRPTAIKVLEAGAAGKEGVTRFEREVQVTSALSHPNTIEIYDFGTTPEGAFYYAMELVRGITLADAVEGEGPMPDARVVHVMRQAAGSIGEAHVAGVIHRDIKPANLMLCERGGILDFVKVLDFGLVRLTEGRGDLGITKTQNLTGTPLYISPEAIESPSTIDVRADVYQLGAVAYYLMTGRPPFEGKTMVDVLARHLNDAATPPSEVLGRDVSPALEAVVMRCLEKEPAKRFADAGALLEALEHCAVSGHWDAADARDWWERWRELHPDDLLAASGSSLGSAPSAYSIDLAGRLGD